MKRLTMAVLLGLVTLSAFASSQKMTCTLTGKEVKTCCCEQQKNAKLFCKLSKKEVDNCCCKGM
jgi:hypothetical protein